MLAIKIHVFVKVSTCVFCVYVYSMYMYVMYMCLCVCGVMVVMVKFLRENYFHQPNTDAHMSINTCGENPRRKKTSTLST